MRVYVINLDKDIDRLKSVDAQLSKLDVAYERVSAVVGRDLPIDEKRRAVNAFRFWCAYGAKALDGEIGCALSHFKIYRKMSGRDVCCILEDDVLIDERFVETLKYVERSIDADKPQVVLLSNHSVNTGVGDSHIGYESPANTPFALNRISADCFTEGYVLTAKAAAAILQQNYPMLTPCDHWGRWVKHGVIDLYHVEPTVCRQAKNNFASGIVLGKIELTRNMPFHKFVWRKTYRACGKIVDLMAQKITGR